MSAVSEILGQSLCAFAFCWRLERRDGVTIGLTSHDRPIETGGLVYEPAPGISPSAILRGGNAADDRTEVGGMLNSAALNEADLEAGRWDGAHALLHLTEWTDPGALWLLLARGTLGSVVRTGERYSVALRGLSNLFERPVAPATSPTCRTALGSVECAVDLRARRRLATLIAQDDTQATFEGLTPGAYPFGTLRWLTGAGAGMTQTIVDQTGDVLHLAEAPPLPVATGTLALLTEGCDKRLSTCSARFANAANFRGEPHLPGMDLLTRYPGA